MHNDGILATGTRRGKVTLINGVNVYKEGDAFKDPKFFPMLPFLKNPYHAMILYNRYDFPIFLFIDAVLCVSVCVI